MVRMLEAHGVRHVFGLCGDTSLPLYDSLLRLDHGITHVLTRDERSATYMADAYARVTGRPGVCEGPSGGGATYILPGLIEAGARIRAYDPEGMDEARKLLPDVEYCAGSYEAMEGADALAVITEWTEFRALDPERMKTLLRHPVVVDLRNVYNPADMKAAGFTYRSIGRPET